MSSQMKSWFNEMWESEEVLLVCTALTEFDEENFGNGDSTPLI